MVEDDFFEEEEPKPYKSSYGSYKSRTPVLDNFSIPFRTLINEDEDAGIRYLYREQESLSLMKALIMTNRQHIALVGEVGIGKETLIKSVAQKIYNGDANASLNKIIFLQLDFDSLMAGTKYRGQFEERMKAILNEIEKNKDQHFIIYIKNLSIYTLANRDSPHNDTFYFLTLFISSKSARIITCFTTDEANLVFKKYGKLFILDRFHIIMVSPPTLKETIDVIKCHKERLYQFYSIEFDDSLITEVIDLSNLYIPLEYQPLKSISVLEDACAAVELHRYADPNDTIVQLKKRFDEDNEKLKLLKDEKNNVIKEQRFEDAAELRQKEKQLIEGIDLLRKEIAKASKQNRNRVKLEDVIMSVNTISGVPLETIRNKEKVPIRTIEKILKGDNELPRFEFLQAQSILHGHEVSIKRGLAFILIPHKKEYDDLFHHYIKPALEFYGLTVLKGDSIFNPGNILSQVWEKIRTAELVVADVSGQNPNVIFELGLCFGIQRCPIILTRDPAELPFNIRNLRYIQYENTITGAAKLGESLKTAVGEFLSAVRGDNI